MRKHSVGLPRQRKKPAVSGAPTPAQEGYWAGSQRLLQSSVRLLTPAQRRVPSELAQTRMIGLQQHTTHEP